jgi:uncharacterized integral membrane protein
MRLRDAFFIVLAVLSFIVLLQNTHVVRVRFLFWQVGMSQIILLPLILLVGFVAGYILGKRSW